VELRGDDGEVVEHQGLPDVPAAHSSPSIVKAITDQNHRRVGSVVLDPKPDALLPREAGALSFGRTGYLLLVDRRSSDIVYDTRGEALGQLWEQARLRDSRRADATFQYAQNDSSRIASVVDRAALPWLVVASTALDEFHEGTLSERAADLLTVLTIALAAAIAFTLLLRRTTRSLDELATAAASIGSGNFDPQLPRSDIPEIDVVASAFLQMANQLRGAVRQIEVSRQLAVIGEFSARLAHEIRNPLTSLKLNLQTLARDVREHRLPAEAAEAVSLSLNEANRLERVARGILELSRNQLRRSAVLSVHDVVHDTVAATRAQLDAHRIDVEVRVPAAHDRVQGDRDQLVGMLVNLLLNAIEAQPNGGRVLIATESHGDASVRVIVADDGRGIPSGIAPRLFQPFTSDKANGTGLGLAIARNAALNHRGTLNIAEAIAGYQGAVFQVTLPLADGEPV
jgi:signal transduction histidine kinase